MYKKVELTFEHEYTEGEVHALIESMERELRNDLAVIEPQILEVLEENEKELEGHDFVIVIDSLELGSIKMGEHTWVATLTFEAVFDYVLWDNVYGDDDPPFQQIVDYAIQMIYQPKPKVYEAWHPDLQCNLTIVHAQDAHIASTIMCALHQASEDTNEQS